MTPKSDAVKPSDAMVSTVRLSSVVMPAIRLDAKYYQEAITLAKARVAGCGIPTVPLEELADAFVPGRMALVLSPNSDVGAPYLRAHDAFDAIPESDRFIVAARTHAYESYLLKEGTILTPSSGRNLGPLAYAGGFLSRFAMTDIMRIVPKTREDGFFLLAYLRTPTGQALIRRGRTGTTVDHLAPGDVLSIPVVAVGRQERAYYVRRMRRVQNLLDAAREALVNAERRLHEYAGLDLDTLKPKYYSSDGARVFTSWVRELGLRLDSAFYDPLVSAARLAVQKSGPCRLDKAAELRQLGRYKRYYVQRGHGRPILSGSHLTQLHPVNLQYISDRSFRAPESFMLKKGWTLFTCDGRAEESLGSTAYVSSLWNDWMASNHVMRVIPLSGYRAGYVYLALRSPFVQIQLKSRATGNVVDALDVPTVSDVLLPALNQEKRDELGMVVEEAWEDVADALRLEEQTVKQLDKLIVDSYESNRRS